MLPLADRLSTLEESATLALAKRVRALKAEGKQVISLTLGEPDFDTPAHIGIAAKTAIDEGDTHYPPVAGQPALREAIAAYFQTHYQIASAPANVVVSNGAKQSVLNVLWALLNPGDEALILAPYWVSYYPMVQLVGGKPVVLKPTEGLKVSAEQIAAAITPRTRILLLNSPNNPSGAVFSPDEVRAIANVVVQHPHLLVISDEIYAHIRYGATHLSIGSLPSVANQVVTVNGVSKAFAMTGWRIGFITAPTEIANAAEKIQGQVTSGASTISQRAATAALTESLTATEGMVAAFRQRRDAFCDKLRAVAPGFAFDTPPGAFYLYPDVSGYLGLKTPTGSVIQTPTDLNEFLLDFAGVAGVPGEAFGTDRHIRYSYATSEPLLFEAAEKLGQALAQLT